MDGALIKTELIKKYLIDKKITKTEFCKRCKISFSVLYKLLNKKRNYNMICLARICKVLGIRFSEIFAENYFGKK